MKKNVFSAIQPNDNITIGHYIGVIKKWIYLQNKYNCFYCIADLHSYTVNLNKKKENILDILCILISLGIDYKKCSIFLQSNVYEHLKLYWLLNCCTYINELKHMTQFKEKSKNNYQFINCGLFNYPVLMASDILLYNSNYVPIGKDQIQHLEFTRIIAKRINKLSCNKIFNLPKYILSSCSKIMSLLNPYKKMSKSDLNKYNVIFLLDSPELISLKIKSCVTDSDLPPKIIFDLIKKPGISNLLNIISGIKNISILELEKKFVGYSYKEFKKIVINEINLFLISLQEKFFYFRKKKKFLKKILLQGKLKARIKAKETIFLIKKLLVDI